MENKPISFHSGIFATSDKNTQKLADGIKDSITDASFDFFFNSIVSVTKEFVDGKTVAIPHAMLALVVKKNRLDLEKYSFGNFKRGEVEKSAYEHAFTCGLSLMNPPVALFLVGEVGYELKSDGNLQDYKKTKQGAKSGVMVVGLLVDNRRKLWISDLYRTKETIHISRGIKLSDEDVKDDFEAIALSKLMLNGIISGYVTGLKNRKRIVI